MATASTSVPSHSRKRWACSGPRPSNPASLAGARADQRGDRPALARVLDLDVAADAVGAQVLEDARGGAGLEIDPDLIVLETQDPHVRLEVSLAIEQRGVAALLAARSPRCRW